MQSTAGAALTACRAEVDPGCAKIKRVEAVIDQGAFTAGGELLISLFTFFGKIAESTRARSSGTAPHHRWLRKFHSEMFRPISPAVVDDDPFTDKRVRAFLGAFNTALGPERLESGRGTQKFCHRFSRENLLLSRITKETLS